MKKLLLLCILFTTLSVQARHADDYTEKYQEKISAATIRNFVASYGASKSLDELCRIFEREFRTMSRMYRDSIRAVRDETSRLRDLREGDHGGSSGGFFRENDATGGSRC